MSVEKWGDFPPMIARRVSRLRWTAALLWIGWVLLAVPTYWAHQSLPPTRELVGFISLSTGLLGLAGIWFIYTIYRIGAVVDRSEADDDST